jgi:hypothetical protein
LKSSVRDPPQIQAWPQSRRQEHQITQALYDPWQDQFLAQAAKAFEGSQCTRKEVRLQQENSRLKPLVGELSSE